MNKQAFRKELKELLTKFEVDKYAGLHNHMMAEHIVRWIEDYVREQNVANLWSNEEQISYFNYMKQKEGKDVV